MDNYLIYIALFGFFLILLLIGLPLAFVLGSTAVVGILWCLNPGVLYQIAQEAVQCGTYFIFITIPLFVLMAEVFSASGFGKETYTAAQKWLYRIPGSLAVSSIYACAGFGAISGSSPITAATIGIVAIPQMIDRGYDRKIAIGSVAAGGTLGIMIPPSLTMIIYGAITETSVGKLFIAGIIPGIVLATMLSLLVTIRVKLNTSLAPSLGKISWGEKFASLKGVWMVGVIAFVVLGTIYTGIATPTEAAAIGASAAILVVIIVGRLNWSSLYKVLLRSATTTSMIIFIIIGGLSISFFINTMGLPHQISEYVISHFPNPWVIMIIINIIYLIMGCFLDPTSILIITLPIMFPTVKAMGFDPIWFGIIVTLNIEIGMVTPPVGLNLYILKAVVPDLGFNEIVSGSVPFILVLIIGLVILMIFPELSLWLPSMMK